jgi:iron complex outermembrane receptor protein
MNSFAARFAVRSDERAEKGRRVNPLSRRLGRALVLFIGLGGAVQAQENPPSATALKKLSLEELVQQEVISVSRRPEVLSEVASGMEVIRDEDIRRSGATNLPEALRLAYNLQVAQINAREWAISSRGSNTTTSNKLLVLIDGRSVYTPLFSGVFWDVQQVFMPDVDRIEVVSGPGGTAWGANAVHGVINVLSKDAKETPGLLTYGGGGTEKREFGGVRYGGRAGDHLYYRVYGLGARQDDSKLTNGSDASDGWKFGQGGFRADWEPAAPTHLTFQGDAYDGTARQLSASDILLRGANFRTKWSHRFSENSEIDVQAYTDWARRDIPSAFSERLTTHDLDAQHRLVLAQRHHVVWGAEFRAMYDRVGNTPALAFLPAHLDTRLYTGFVQDTFDLQPDSLRLTLGSKIEHNDFSGFEYQPSVRLAWLIAPRQTVWGAISRAVRTPSRVDRDFYVPGTGPYILAGGQGFESEKMVAYELGFRGQPAKTISFTTTFFYHDYDDVRSIEPSPTAFVVANGLDGSAWGGEAKIEYQMSEWWKWQGGFTHLERHIGLKPWSRDLNRGLAEGSDPRYQLFLSWAFDLPHHVGLNLYFRRIGELPTVNGAVTSTLPTYSDVDASASWLLARDLTLSLTGRGLLHDNHVEFGAPAARRSIERSVYATLTWRY